jgi:ribosome-associated translation inhibitor RaiA
MESGTATRALERCSSRLDRLLDGPNTLRAVVEGAAPEYRVSLTLNMRQSVLNAEVSGHDLSGLVTQACERMRVQMVRKRQRRSSQRHREVTAS